MKRWIFSITLMLSSLLALAHNQEKQDHDQKVSPQMFFPHEKGHINPDSVRTGYLSVRPMEIEKFDGPNRMKLESAFDVLEKVVNSEEFKTRVINFKNTKGERAFDSNKGLTNEEIYEIFMDGRETLQPDTPGEMNLFLRLYNRPWSRVIGYTSPNTNFISVNLKFFRNFNPHQVASNLAHEWLHKLAFDHISAAERDSVPYAIGYIVGEMAEKYGVNKK